MMPTRWIAGLAAVGLGFVSGMCGVAAAVASPAAGSPAAAASTPMERPNFVVLVADDIGYTDIGAFGSEIATPHLDALARRGARFSNFHVAASCSPTRAMLLTGVDHHRNGVGNMRETIPREHFGQPGYLTVLDRNVVTVASRLQAAGYRTYATGKWHVGHEPHNLPPARGFHRSLIQADSGSDNWETAQRYLGLTDQVNWYEDGRRARMPAEFYSSAFFVDRLLDYLREEGREVMPAGAARPAPRQRQPFFAYVGFQANHLPVQAPRTFRERYRGRYDAGWEALRRERIARAVAAGLLPAPPRVAEIPGTPDWDSLDPEERAFAARNMEVYAGMAEAMDFHVGRLIEYLREAGELERTVFVFLSDNGPEGSDPYDTLPGRLWLETQYSRDAERLGEKGTYGVIGPGWATAAAGPLYGYKFYAGEGGVRVPLIIAGAPGQRGGAIHTTFTRVVDLAPTLLEMAGLPASVAVWDGQSVEPVVGRSLLPLLQGARPAVYGPEEPVGFELSGNAALYKGTYKLVRLLPPAGDGQWHLYDLATDIGETRDLATIEPARFAAMLADYGEYVRRNNVLPMPVDYRPTQQVMSNALHNVYWPALRRQWPWGLLLLLAIGAWWWRRRRALPARQRPAQ